MELNDMNSVRRIISEGFPALPTLVRFFTGMLSEVSCQRIFTGERFVTFHACVRFVSRVKKNVTVEGSLCIKDIISSTFVHNAFAVCFFFHFKCGISYIFGKNFLS